MDLKEVKQFLKENAEKDDVKSYLAELKGDPEKIIEDYKNSKEFKSEIDRHVTKGIETFEKKTLPEREKKIRQDIENELNPPKTDSEKALEKRLKELEEESRKSKEEAKKAQRLSFYSSKLSEKKLDPDFIKLVDGSLETDDDVIKHIENIHNKIYQNGVNYKLKEGAEKPKQGNQNVSSGQLTREDLKGMSPSEITKAKDEGRLNEILGRTGD